MPRETRGRDAAGAQMLGAGEGGGGARLMKMELWRKCVRGRSSLGWVMRMVMVKR